MNFPMRVVSERCPADSSAHRTCKAPRPLLQAICHGLHDHADGLAVFVTKDLEVAEYGDHLDWLVLRVRFIADEVGHPEPEQLRELDDQSGQRFAVIRVGGSTSGCIRATAVDAMQHGYRTIVVRVRRRPLAPHEANLFDIKAKYGDVIDRPEAIDYLGKQVHS